MNQLSGKADALRRLRGVLDRVPALMGLPYDRSRRVARRQPSPRARQNVIFELGFFIGRLGRERVCALTKGSPEIPSDYAGVAYVTMDTASQWKMEVVKELKAAGLDVDANKAF